MKMKNYWKLIISLIIPQLVGLLGSIFTSSSVSTWYATLSKPAFNPPNWLFGPVWTVLFILMGISLYLVWKDKPTKIALVFFSIQMGLNLLWSILFFGLKSPLAALIEIIFLEITILLTMIYFYKINKTTIYLLSPYFLWVFFATILNFSIYWLN